MQQLKIICTSILSFLLTLIVSAQGHVTWQPLREPGCGGWLTSLGVDPSHSNHVLLGGDMLGVGVSNDSGNNWSTASGFLSYEIANFTFNVKKPNQIWVGTMSGPFVSNDGGTHWASKRNGLPAISGENYSAPIQQVLIDPANDGRLLAFGGSWRDWSSPGQPKFGWIWESLDGGENWCEYSTIYPYHNIRWIAAASGGLNVLYASVKNLGLYKSIDGGKTWSDLTSALPSKNVNQIATHPTDPNTVWVSMSNFQPKGSDVVQPGGIWKSTDAGKTWKICSNGLPQKSNASDHFASSFDCITVSTSNPDVLYTSNTVWDAPAIFRSDDGGTSWRMVFDEGLHHSASPTAYPAGLGATVITVDPKNPNIVYCAGSESVIKSTDGGKNWNDTVSEVVNNPASPTAMYFKGRGYSGLCSLSVHFDPFNPAITALMAMDAGRLWISEDKQKSWRFCSEGFPSPWGGGIDLAFGGKDGKTLLGTFGQNGGDANVALSSDGGYTWKIVSRDGSGLPSGGRGYPGGVYVLPDASGNMWVVYDGKLYHSDNGGKNWEIQMEGDFYGITAAAPKTPLAFYLTGATGVQKTTDGKHFTALPYGPKPIASLVVDYQQPGVLYVTQGYRSGGGIWKYNGTTWTKVFDNYLVSGLTIDPTDGRRIAASTKQDPYKDVCDATGAWLSEDGGKTWSNEIEGLVCLRGSSIAINPHDPEQIIYCSNGRGFFVGHWQKHKDH